MQTVLSTEFYKAYETVIATLDMYDEEELSLIQDKEEYAMLEASRMIEESVEEIRCRLYDYGDCHFLVIADLGLWNGRHKRYAFYRDTNLEEILNPIYNLESVTYFIEDGDLHAIGYHHDGINKYTFRIIPSDEDFDALEELYDASIGKLSEEDLKAHTEPLEMILEEICA